MSGNEYNEFLGNFNKDIGSIDKKVSNNDTVSPSSEESIKGVKLKDLYDYISVTPIDTLADEVLKLEDEGKYKLIRYYYTLAKSPKSEALKALVDLKRNLRPVKVVEEFKEEVTPEEIALEVSSRRDAINTFEASYRKNKALEARRYEEKKKKMSDTAWRKFKVRSISLVLAVTAGAAGIKMGIDALHEKQVVNSFVNSNKYIVTENTHKTDDLQYTMYDYSHIADKLIDSKDTTEAEIVNYSVFSNLRYDQYKQMDKIWVYAQDLIKGIDEENSRRMSSIRDGESVELRYVSDDVRNIFNAYPSFSEMVAARGGEDDYKKDLHDLMMHVYEIENAQTIEQNLDEGVSYGR